MLAERPRFRQDLLAELIEEHGKKFIDVADPDNGTCYRFYEVEYSLACAMDGERDVAGIVKWATDELGMTPKTDEVKSVIATLGSLGFIDTGVKTARPSAQENRWEAPTSMGDANDYLKPGVVAGKPAAAASSAEDVELGHAGTNKRSSTPLPDVGDMELGAPGGVGSKVEKTVGTQEIPLGASGKAPDLSVDLADQVAIRPDDVKEAVRASQVMKAVDVPKELLDSVEPVVAKEPAKADAPPARPTPPPRVPTPAPMPKVEAKAEAKKPEPKVEAKKPEPAKKPDAAPAKAPPAPAPKVSPMLLVALVLVVLGAGAFVAYKFVIKKSDATDQQSQNPPPPPKAPEPPPPPPVETEKLASEQPAAVELKPPAAGQLEMIVANDATVKQGDIVAALAGHKPIETEISTMQKDIEKRLQTDVANAEKERDAAEKAGNKPGVTAAEKKIETAKKALEDKQQKLAQRTTDLEKFVVKAPVAGKVAAIGKANAKVAPADVIAKVTPEPMLVATFKKTDPAVTVDQRVLLATMSGEQKLSCKVVDAAGGTKIACPKDAAPEGTEVKFAGIDTSAPPNEIEMGDEKGSAAGSGSATGSGSAAPAKAPEKAAPAKAPEKAAAPAPAPRPAPPTPKPADKPAETPAPATGSGSAQ